MGCKKGLRGVEKSLILYSLLISRGRYYVGTESVRLAPDEKFRNTRQPWDSGAVKNFVSERTSMFNSLGYKESFVRIRNFSRHQNPTAVSNNP